MVRYVNPTASNNASSTALSRRLLTATGARGAARAMPKQGWRSSCWLGAVQQRLGAISTLVHGLA